MCSNVSASPHRSRSVIPAMWEQPKLFSEETLAVALLVLYPLIDAVSSFINHRTSPVVCERRVNAFNAELSTVAAFALGLAGGDGVALTLTVFGAWAIIFGPAQFLLGLRRRGAELGGQGPMLIAGGLWVIAGISFDPDHVRPAVAQCLVGVRHRLRHLLHPAAAAAGAANPSAAGGHRLLVPICESRRHPVCWMTPTHASLRRAKPIGPYARHGESHEAKSVG